MSHPRHAEQAIALKSCRYVNIKPGRVGGLTNAKIIHDLCQQAGIPCWVGGMLESATGAGACVALAMLDNFTYPADIFPSSRFYHQDLAERPLELTTLADGTPAVAAFDDIPEPDAARLEKLCVARATVRVADALDFRWLKGKIAACISSAEAKRSAGSLARTRWMIVASSSGICGQTF